MTTYKLCRATGKMEIIDTPEQKMKELREEINRIISIINSNYFALQQHAITGEEYTGNNLYLMGKLCKKQLKLSELDPTYKEYGRYTNMGYGEDFDPRDV